MLGELLEQSPKPGTYAVEDQGDERTTQTFPDAAQLQVIRPWKGTDLSSLP